jgi:glutamate-1-semialdehyde 2,1-aminomutase
MKVLAIVQARMGSTRLPDKVMRKVGGVTVIELLLTRLSESNAINQIVVATSIDSANDPLVQHVNGLGYETFQGSEQDVLDRFYFAAKQFDADIVIRITGDCPLTDPILVDDQWC